MLSPTARFISAAVITKLGGVVSEVDTTIVIDWLSTRPVESFASTVTE